MGSYAYPVALHWNEDPEKLKKLKNKLLLYFQKSKSNGGDCEIRDMDCSRGYILIHFKDQEARDRVLQKETHELKLPGGEKMMLDIKSLEADGGAAQAQNNETQGPPSSLVLIENLQHSYTPEMLNLLIENVSGKIEDADFYVERIQEKQSAVITFTCNIDTLNIVEKLTNHSRVKTSKMKVKVLEETGTIRIEGLPPNTPDDYISLYFENPNNGSPGCIEHAIVLPNEDAALVTFTTVEAAKKVLGRKHQFSRKEVSVYPYYLSQDIVLYGKQRPEVKKPEPLTFQISPYILEFILNNSQLKDDMEKTMGTHKCDIKWPELLSPDPIITLCFPDALSTDIRTLTKLVPTWKDEVKMTFSLLISKYKVVEYQIDQSVWGVVREHANTYNGVLMKPDFGSQKVFLAGLVKDVTKIDPIFRKLVEEITKQVERDKNIQTEILSMSPALYQITHNSGLPRKILDQVPELKMDYDVPTKKIRLSGLKEEVLTAKCEILSITQQIKSKSIQMNPHLVQFLKSTDNEELSCLLFINDKINALLEIEDDAVTLTAFSKVDLMKAEEQINKELVYRQYVVEDKNIFRSPEWRSLSLYLLESCNAEKSTVLIQESISEVQNNVVIAGLASNVPKCCHQISDFLDKNTPIEKTIKAASLAVMQFFKEEKKQVLNKCTNDNLSVAIRNKNIRLKGPKTYVTEAYSLISDILHSLYSDTLCIDKPGARKFCLSNEDLYVTMAKNKFGCFLHFQKEEEEDTMEDEIEEVKEPQCKVNLPNGVVISVHKHNLCSLNVDAIVNAANEELKHIGGLALALLKAAGPKLQDECDQIVRTEGRLSAGEAVITESGRLPCKQVIHTVGPRWNSSAPTECERLLQKAVICSLELADQFCHTSIAIPAVSSGIFGFPVDKSAENIIKAIKQYMDSKPKGSSTIKYIHLVDTIDDTVRIFASTLKKEFRGEEEEPFPKYRERGAGRMETSVPKTRVYKTNVSTDQMLTKENIIIKVREGFIQDAATDVIVNSIGKDLHLGSGGASKALLGKAGNNLQQCLREASSGVQVAGGSVFITKGCNLNCKIVIHVVVPHWEGGKGSSEKIFREIVRKCLCESEKNRMSSISFPAIGTGVLGFPKRTAASLMFEEILKFSSKSNPQHLREVAFILHPSDKETLTVSFFGYVRAPMAGTHEINIGSVIYQVKTGDITKENADIIVNSTNQTFNMKSGVSKAILEAAGQSVEDECAQLGSQGNKDHIVTQNGNLLCKKILHKILGSSSASGIKTFITESLTECARLQAKSVAFPAIGTGIGNVPSSVVADSILESVADFARSPQSIQMVKVVIFQEQMLNDFHTSMKKKEGAALTKQEGFLTKVKKSVFGLFGWNSKTSEDTKVIELKENIEPAIIELCAESQDSVNKTKNWLRDLIIKEQYENIITDNWIEDFEEKECEDIDQLQKSYQVSLTVDLTNVTITVVGLSRDVLEVSNKIQHMIKNLRDKKTREREAELCSNLVEWGYISGNNFIPFDKMTNMELEKAQNEGSQSFSIDINGVKYTVIIELLTASDPKGNDVKLQRNSKHGKLDVPKGWDPMNNENMKVVQLSPGGQEYNGVVAKFNNSCHMRIIKIERIQNRHLWLNYQIKKQSIDDKNCSTNNEKQLFHGCDFSTLNIINHNGFNRSYAGKNAACYGNGTYFAVHANYSAHDTYSRPDGNGYKYMYLSRVVTGVSCIGRQGMIAPPPRNPSKPTDLYDSLTDNQTNPSMYVIFHDIQAYPEYLITFTK
uniref:Poly [ADP-ribose] polymerase n=1 Tax=Pyxicephalus adspersus TaxID=30357 RepID=A0AAV3A0X1_PYXAD|nr:TPA: hypothetical protein GDO54_015365 [Pyxicephalus adspersus]